MMDRKKVEKDILLRLKSLYLTSSPEVKLGLLNALGISNVSLSQYINGHCNITLRKLLIILDYYNLTLEEFLSIKVYV